MSAPHVSAEQVQADGSKLVITENGTWQVDAMGRETHLDDASVRYEVRRHRESAERFEIYDGQAHVVIHSWLTAAHASAVLQARLILDEFAERER
jgi:hypothetical protein